jgi:hypothetical protein
MSKILLVAEEALKKQDYQSVIDLTTQATKEDPKDYRGWALRGAVMLLLKNYYPAILNNDKALEIEPNLYQALNNRGACYIALDLLDEATTDLNKALEISPDSWEPHLQLGLMYGSLDNFTAAEYHLSEAARLGSKDGKGKHVVHAAYGTLLLGLGKWKEGFAEDLYRPEIMHQPFTAPHWHGEDLNGKHILLFSEGGQGDRILSLRYINSILGYYPYVQVTVKVPKGFLRFTEHSFPGVAVTQNNVDSNYVCSLPNIPMVLDMTWDTVPRPIKYLSVDQRLIDAWEPKIKELPRGLNIGLCWASLNGITKVLPDKAIEKLGEIPNVNFISLQVPHHECKAKIKLLNWSDHITDWADTAALIESLDLIISVDTAVAHMAGALGKPVWTIVKYSTYWPWLDPRIPPTPRYSIWYPSMELFRQQVANDWMMPISRVILTLQRHLVGLT